MERVRPGMTAEEVASVIDRVAQQVPHDALTVHELAEVSRVEILRSIQAMHASTSAEGATGAANSDEWANREDDDERSSHTVVQAMPQEGQARWAAFAVELYRCPRPGSEAAWQYEMIKAFTVELSALAVALNDVCTAQTCPQMKATDEWMYLCAAHKQPQECPAIDYIVHTLDGTAALLNSNKWFPSRSEIQDSSLKYFQSITRRCAPHVTPPCRGSAPARLCRQRAHRGVNFVPNGFIC